jgi:hypothetical protein
MQILEDPIVRYAILAIPTGRLRQLFLPFSQEQDVGCGRVDHKGRGFLSDLDLLSTLAVSAELIPEARRADAGCGFCTGSSSCRRSGRVGDFNPRRGRVTAVPIRVDSRLAAHARRATRNARGPHRGAGAAGGPNRPHTPIPRSRCPVRGPGFLPARKPAAGGACRLRLPPGIAPAVQPGGARPSGTLGAIARYCRWALDSGMTYPACLRSMSSRQSCRGIVHVPEAPTGEAQCINRYQGECGYA